MINKSGYQVPPGVPIIKKRSMRNTETQTESKPFIASENDSIDVIHGPYKTFPISTLAIELEQSNFIPVVQTPNNKLHASYYREDTERENRSFANGTTQTDPGLVGETITLDDCCVLTNTYTTTQKQYMNNYEILGFKSPDLAKKFNKTFIRKNKRKFPAHFVMAYLTNVWHDAITSKL